MTDTTSNSLELRQGDQSTRDAATIRKDLYLEADFIKSAADLVAVVDHHYQLEELQAGSVASMMERICGATERISGLVEELENAPVREGV